MTQPLLHTLPKPKAAVLKPAVPTPARHTWIKQIVTFPPRPTPLPHRHPGIQRLDCICICVVLGPTSKHEAATWLPVLLLAPGFPSLPLLLHPHAFGCTRARWCVLPAACRSEIPAAACSWELARPGCQWHLPPQPIEHTTAQHDSVGEQCSPCVAFLRVYPQAWQADT